MNQSTSRSPEFDYVICGVLLTTPEGWLICQHRDGNTKFSPHLACMFGGRMEPGDKTAADGARRELEEETNIRGAQIEPFMTYVAVTHGYREQLHVFVSHGHTTDGLEVYEGQGYVVIKSADDPLIAPIMQPAIDAWFAKKS